MAVVWTGHERQFFLGMWRKLSFLKTKLCLAIDEPVFMKQIVMEGQLGRGLVCLYFGCEVFFLFTFVAMYGSRSGQVAVFVGSLDY